ncbi:dipeptidyl aminopeptidase/acylaminoacyl peptidase [Pelomonas saccharophila]|uniref:Dipeptidyl aminopeptidase/acylaminoacyl peptidase n=1 Tax=Roseateles saccharophilus TaxID=304 RepID=A0ABU1YUA3_ROSSA|nr:S9 family peptidase [Roseateles saccharophilus]MDR7272453.1 dipeptidyl aminopeptidase/acylaminoacyl peptidase [Roseateles saccharophilus]
MKKLIIEMTDPLGVTAMELSPDGKHIVVIAWTGRANALMLIETTTWETRLLVAPQFLPGWTGPIQPLRVHWISDALLAVDFSDGHCSVVGFDGRRGRVLGGHFMRMIAPDKPGELPQWAIVSTQGFLVGTGIRRINIVTGEKVTVPIGLPGDLVSAVFDRSGRLRAARTRETKWFTPGAKITNWYRHDEASPWQQVAQASMTEDLWTPLGLPDDSDTLVALSREGRDTWAMFDFDVATRKLTNLRVGHPTEDLIGTQEDAGLNAIQATTHGLKPTTYWFDARWDHLQRSIDKALPDTVNILRGNPQGKVLVFSYSDRDPGRWLFLDTEKMSLREVSGSRAGIEPGAMRPMQMLSYAAADGLTIPAYLTLPDDGPAKPRPMVVYIHGGPVARDNWIWDFDVQLLAAAGYAVFQPQFRGSSGFGRKFEHAGYRQWGLAMQDDVTAGVKAMIDQGIADPSRICIYGASYGGYAALWGLVKTPELFKCGISLAGVTDIGERFTDWSDTNSTEAGREWLRFAVGDINTMAAQFQAVSPEKHAARIRVPVLLAHGTEDKRVPIGHSKRMASALKAAGASVETHWYEDEEHGLRSIANIQKFNAALLDFLDRNIGPASPMAAAASAPSN